MIARALNTAVEYSGAERTLQKPLSGICEKLSSETDPADDKEENIQDIWTASGPGGCWRRGILSSACRLQRGAGAASECRVEALKDN